MGILDGIVEWLAEQVMYGLDLITNSVLGALGCDMTVFTRYFPAAETMYQIFTALALGIILLNWVWQLFRNFGLGIGLEAEDPIKLSLRSVLFIIMALFADDIVELVLKIGGTPYDWIPTYNGERGCPLLIPSQLLPKIENMTIPGNLTEFVRSNANIVQVLAVRDPGIVSQSVWCEAEPDEIRVRMTLKITKGTGFASPDTLQLLRLIDSNESVKAAANYMGISYSLAWKLIDRAEQALGYSLVWRQQGGSHGGATRLNNKGLDFVGRYEKLINEVKKVKNQKFQNLFPELAESDAEM
jgi:molybdate transport repressor ModE-like protein